MTQNGTGSVVGDRPTGSGGTRLGLDLARGSAGPKVHGHGIGAGDARRGSAAPVDGAPAFAAPGPGDAAHKAVQLIGALGSFSEHAQWSGRAIALSARATTPGTPCTAALARLGHAAPP